MKKTSSDHAEQRRKVLSEAFHSFHQPLTTLHCGLEIALLREQSPHEYRERIKAALGSAGLILQLNKALRELAEATDPGERWGTVSLAPLMAQLADELSLVADPARVAVTAVCDGDIQVSADPLKFLQCLANLGASLIRVAASESRLSFQAAAHDKNVEIAIRLDGDQNASVESSIEDKLAAIRIDAACSYAWTLGGEFVKTRNGFEIQLPLAK